MSISMGNDKFILYIRKRYPDCSITNEHLGRCIWAWMQEHDLTAEKSTVDEACYWGNSGSFIAPQQLPKTATQFGFDRAILPDLYTFLDHLGQE